MRQLEAGARTAAVGDGEGAVEVVDPRGEHHVEPFPQLRVDRVRRGPGALNDQERKA